MWWCYSNKYWATTNKYNFDTDFRFSQFFCAKTTNYARILKLIWNTPSKIINIVYPTIFLLFELILFYQYPIFNFYHPIKFEMGTKIYTLKRTQKIGCGKDLSIIMHA